MREVAKFKAFANFAIIALIATDLAFTALVAAKFAAIKLAACVPFAAAVSVRLGAASKLLAKPVNLINFTACMAQEFSLATFAGAASGFFDAKFKALSDLGAAFARQGRACRILRGKLCKISKNEILRAAILRS